MREIPSGSYAVMAQRREPHDSLDDFPTPPWAARALCEHVLFRTGAPKWNPHCLPTVCSRLGLGDPVAPDGKLVPPHFPVAGLSVWEPACNRGFLVKALREYFSTVVASDVHDYGLADAFHHDFLMPGEPPAMRPHWIITNPPFRLGAEFVLRALALARSGVAMLVRLSFLEGGERFSTLYTPHPPTVVAPFAERVPMVKGRCDPEASTATAYCWLVWLKDAVPQHPVWIPPCRKQLERPGDYDPPVQP